MSLSPARRLYVYGAIMLVSMAICSQHFSRLGSPSFLTALAVAAIAYLLALRELLSNPEYPQRVVVIGLVLAALWHIPFLWTSPGPDDDIHRYVWDGRVQRLGYNPYVVIPNDPALVQLHTAETRTLNHPDLPSLYPPGAELFFRGVTAVHESIFALKVVFVLCDFAITFILLDLLRSRGQGPHWVLIYAWNPLLAVEVAGSGHIDIVGVLCLLVSAAALARRWRALAAVALALAIAVKFLPIVLLPLYWKRLRIRDCALAVVVAGLLYVPFLDHGRVPTGSLGTYIQSYRFNAPLFAALERVAEPRLVLAMAVLVGFLTAMWLRSRAAGESADAFAWPMAASLLCAPVVYPWYLLWLLPFVRSAATVPIMIWTVSIISTYYVWHLRALGRLWILPAWIMPLEYGAVALAGAMIVMRRFLRPAVRSATDHDTQDRAPSDDPSAEATPSNVDAG